MGVIDWRELYAANRAAIARAGIAPTPTSAAAPLRARAGRAATPGATGRSQSRRDASPALVYVPPGLDPAVPAPLVCMLHGCTQDPDRFAAGTLMNDAADRHGLVVVYPAQSRGSNPQGCWNWFLPAHQRRGAGEPAAIARIVRELIETGPGCTIDPRQVFVAGLSSGGAMAAILGACYPDLFAAVAVHSGLPYRAATDMGSAFAAMSRGAGDADARGHAAHAAMGEHARPVPTIVVHGSADRTVSPVNAVEVLRQSMTANRLASPLSCEFDPARPTTSRRLRVDGGHSYTTSRWHDAEGAPMHELLEVHGLGHAWSGGARGGSYTDPRGPSATAAIWAFFADAGSSRPM